MKPSSPLYEVPGPALPQSQDESLESLWSFAPEKLTSEQIKLIRLKVRYQTKKATDCFQRMLIRIHIPQNSVFQAGVEYIKDCESMTDIELLVQIATWNEDKLNHEATRILLTYIHTQLSHEISVENDPSLHLLDNISRQATTLVQHLTDVTLRESFRFLNTNAQEAITKKTQIWPCQNEALFETVKLRLSKILPLIYTRGRALTEKHVRFINLQIDKIKVFSRKHKGQGKERIIFERDHLEFQKFEQKVLDKVFTPSGIDCSRATVGSYNSFFVLGFKYRAFEIKTSDKGRLFIAMPIHNADLPLIYLGRPDDHSRSGYQLYLNEKISGQTQNWEKQILSFKMAETQETFESFYLLPDIEGMPREDILKYRVPLKDEFKNMPEPSSHTQLSSTHTPCPVKPITGNKLKDLPSTPLQFEAKLTYAKKKKLRLQLALRTAEESYQEYCVCLHNSVKDTKTNYRTDYKSWNHETLTTTRQEFEKDLDLLICSIQSTDEAEMPVTDIEKFDCCTFEKEFKPYLDEYIDASHYNVIQLKAVANNIHLQAKRAIHDKMQKTKTCQQHEQIKTFTGLDVQKTFGIGVKYHGPARLSDDKDWIPSGHGTLTWTNGDTLTANFNFKGSLRSNQDIRLKDVTYIKCGDLGYKYLGGWIVSKNSEGDVTHNKDGDGVKTRLVDGTETKLFGLWKKGKREGLFKKVVKGSSPVTLNYDDAGKQIRGSTSASSRETPTQERESLLNMQDLKQLSRLRFSPETTSQYCDLLKAACPSPFAHKVEEKRLLIDMILHSTDSIRGGIVLHYFQELAPNLLTLLLKNLETLNLCHIILDMKDAAVFRINFEALQNCANAIASIYDEYKEMVGFAGILSRRKGAPCYNIRDKKRLYDMFSVREALSKDFLTNGIHSDDFDSVFKKTTKLCISQGLDIEDTFKIEKKQDVLDELLETNKEYSRNIDAVKGILTYLISQADDGFIYRCFIRATTDLFDEGKAYSICSQAVLREPIELSKDFKDSPESLDEFKKLIRKGKIVLFKSTKILQLLETYLNYNEERSICVAGETQSLLQEIQSKVFTGICKAINLSQESLEAILRLLKVHKEILSKLIERDIIKIEEPSASLHSPKPKKDLLVPFLTDFSVLSVSISMSMSKESKAEAVDESGPITVEKVLEIPEKINGMMDRLQKAIDECSVEDIQNDYAFIYNTLQKNHTKLVKSTHKYKMSIMGICDRDDHQIQLLRNHLYKVAGILQNEINANLKVCQVLQEQRARKES